MTASVAVRLGILRTPEALLELVHERQIDARQPWRTTHAATLRPLPPGAEPELQASFAALAEWSAPGDGARHHLQRVLEQTVPLMGAFPGDLPALELRAPAEPPRPTAAHPRAYRGTKQKPPRAARPGPLDVRPYLGSRRELDRLLDELPDPYLARHHPRAGGGSWASLPGWFVSHLLPGLPGMPWPEVLALVTLLRASSPAGSPPSNGDEPPLPLGLLMGLVHIGGRDDATRLVATVLEHPAPYRERFATLLFSVVPTLVEAAALEPATLCRVLELCDDESYGPRMHTYLDGLTRGASSDYLIDGLALAVEHDPGHAFGSVPAGRLPVAAPINALLAHLQPALRDASDRRYRALQLWRSAGELEGFAALLEHPRMGRLAPGATLDVLRLLIDPSIWLAPREGRDAYQLVRAELEAILALLESCTPDFQTKVSDQLVCLVGWQLERPALLATHLRRGLAFLERTSRPPFGDTGAPEVVQHLLRLEEAQRLRLLQAPDASFLAMEKACRRSNDGTLIGWGMGSLVRHLAELVTRTFSGCIGKLLQTARLLGTLSLAQGDELAREVAGGALMQARVADLPVSELLALLDENLPRGHTSLVPRRLREHQAGARNLTPAQLERDRRTLAEGLDGARLDQLASLALARLGRAVGVARPEGDLRHALGLLHADRRNQRPFRRFLRALVEGKDDWGLGHPRTREWLSRHPQLALETWRTGIDLAADLDGRVELRIEQDPLEVLKLGTHVGSCLGLGGGLSFSAVAVLLDVNKQVVYARDGKGAVLGRQLLALSEEDQLVCFEVYPGSASDGLKRLFARYDQELAARLGLSLFRPGEGALYTVASILASEFWDDGAWRGLSEADE